MSLDLQDVFSMFLNEKQKVIAESTLLKKKEIIVISHFVCHQTHSEFDYLRPALNITFLPAKVRQIK